MNELPRPPLPEAPRTLETPAPRRRRAWPWLLLLVLAGGGGWYAWQRGLLPFLPPPQPAATTQPQGFGPSGGPRGRGGLAVPVSAAEATITDMPIVLDALGTVQAFNTIAIVPQVAGRIIEIAFTEGQEVRAGDVLVRLDPRALQAALDQAVATKAQREAQLANARLDLQRYMTLMRGQGTFGSTRQAQTSARITLLARCESMPKYHALGRSDTM